MVFVSIRGRVLINVEALNMTESVGNYVKHRKVPVISPKTYTVYFVPAISGESIAHGYQEVLAKEAKKRGLPVCKLCEMGIFLKSTNKNVFEDAFGKEVPQDDDELEKTIISECVVEDVGGFLYAHGNRNIKRTSNFSVGYMIPVNEAIESIVIEPQLHSRYALGTKFVERGTQGQMIYYVELSSAPYTFSYDLDTKYIGKLTFSVDHAGKPAVNDGIKDRICIAIESLKEFLVEMRFGAKKTRFLPVIDWESTVIAVSDNVWTVPSPSSASYIESAIKKLEKRDDNTKLFIYVNPEMLEDTSIYVKKKTEELIESFYQALEEFRKKLAEKGDENLVDWEKIKKEKMEEFIKKRANEVVESEDVKYTNKVKEKYAKIIEEIRNRGELANKVYLFNNFVECVTAAMEEAVNRVK